MTPDITIYCPTCGKQQPYSHEADPSLPSHVVSIEIRCEQCNSGDFDTELWFDADGKEIEQS